MTVKKDLMGKTALVTGASSGLGAEFARQLAARGADVILVARRRDRLENLAQEIRSGFGTRAFVYTSDLGQADAPLTLFNSVKNDGLQVDILINNAGFGLWGFFQDVPWEKTAQMLDVDIRALTCLTRLFSEEMSARHTGYILLIASTGAYQPTPTYAAYGAAKSYVLSFGEALNFELKKQKTGVSVSVLSPGVTATEFFEASGQEKTLFHKMTIMKAEKVVSIGLKGLFHKRPSFVAGWLNKVMAWMIRWMPRRAVPGMAYRMMKKG